MHFSSTKLYNRTYELEVRKCFTWVGKHHSKKNEYLKLKTFITQLESGWPSKFGNKIQTKIAKSKLLLNIAEENFNFNTEAKVRNTK